MIKAKLDKYLGLTVLGYVLLIIGCALPVVSFSFGDMSENVSLLSDGGDGVMIIGILVLSLPIVVMARHRALLIPAILTFGIIMLNFVDIRGDELAMELFDFQWPAWIVLFAGSASLAAAAALAFVERRGASKADDMIPAAA